MKKLLLFIALVVASLALQACESNCLANFHDGKIGESCALPGTVIPGE